MQLLYKPDMERVRTYWRAYWEGELMDRPLVCVRTPKSPREPLPVTRYMDGVEGDYLEAVKRFDDTAKNSYYGGELVPQMPISFGPDQFALFFGGEYSVSFETATAWIHPYVREWEEIPFELDTRENGVYRQLLEFYRIAADYGRGKFLPCLLDLHSQMDCLSAMRGAQNLCFDLYDCYEALKRANLRARAQYIPIYDSFFQAGKLDETGSSGWIPFYCEGKFTTVQCDYMGLVSNEIAKDLILPALEEETSYLDHSVLHLDGKDALRHLDDLLAIKKLDAIQWVPGDGQPKTYEWMDLLKKIQAAGKGLHLHDWSVEAIKRYYKELKPTGLVFELTLPTQQEADSLLEWLKENT